MANSLIDFGIVQPEASGSFLRGFQGAQAQQQQNQLAALHLRAAQRGEEEALTEREAAKGATSFQDLAQRYQQAGLTKQALAAQKAFQEQRAAQITQAKNAIDLMQDAASKVVGNPNLEFAKRVVTQYGQTTGQDISTDLADLEKIGNDPAGIQQWAASHALKAKDLLPQFEKFDTGAGQVRMGFHPVTGAPIAQPTTQPAPQQNLPIGAFQGQPQEIMNQLAAIADPAERAAATQAYQRQIAGQVQPTGIGQTTFIPKMPLPPELEAQKIRIAEASRPTVNVSTEKKYSEAFAGKLAESDIGMRDAALKAPEMANTANRILDLTAQGKIFTGTGANVKLQIAKALNMAGLTDSEKAANTEALIADMGASTLAAIKTSGLGSGQGFTNKDLEFLQNVAGGRITLEKDSIQRIAELQHRAAEASAQKWNARVRQIPSATLEGTGLSSEPIQVPKKAGGKAVSAAPLTNAKGWTLHTDAAGNKAYVSPDGKQFEEVK